MLQRLASLWPLAARLQVDDSQHYNRQQAHVEGQPERVCPVTSGIQDEVSDESPGEEQDERQEADRDVSALAQHFIPPRGWGTLGTPRSYVVATGKALVQPNMYCEIEAI